MKRMRTWMLGLLWMCTVAGCSRPQNGGPLLVRSEGVRTECVSSSETTDSALDGIYNDIVKIKKSMTLNNIENAIGKGVFDRAVEGRVIYMWHGTEFALFVYFGEDFVAQTAYRATYYGRRR